MSMPMVGNAPKKEEKGKKFRKKDDYNQEWLVISLEGNNQVTKDEAEKLSILRDNLRYVTRHHCLAGKEVGNEKYLYKVFYLKPEHPRYSDAPIAKRRTRKADGRKAWMINLKVVRPELFEPSAMQSNWGVSERVQVPATKASSKVVSRNMGNSEKVNVVQSVTHGKGVSVSVANEEEEQARFEDMKKRGAARAMAHKEELAAKVAKVAKVKKEESVGISRGISSFF